MKIFVLSVCLYSHYAQAKIYFNKNIESHKGNREDNICLFYLYLFFLLLICHFWRKNKNKQNKYKLIILIPSKTKPDNLTIFLCKKIFAKCQAQFFHPNYNGTKN